MISVEISPLSDSRGDTENPMNANSGSNLGPNGSIVSNQSKSDARARSRSRSDFSTTSNTSTASGLDSRGATDRERFDSIPEMDDLNYGILPYVHWIAFGNGHNFVIPICLAWFCGAMIFIGRIISQENWSTIAVDILMYIALIIESESFKFIYR